MPDLETRPLSCLLGWAADGAGISLGALFAMVATARRSKPLHPVGTVAPAVLTVTSPGAPGCPLLDEPGEHGCLVRASYAVGSGPALPDIEGLALRVLPSAGAPHLIDLLFASTGVGPLGRYLLAVRLPGRHGAQTTLLPVRAGGRPLQLRLEPLDPLSQPWPASYVLSWAHGRGSWRPVGTLTVAWEGRADAPERFDPVVHPLPGAAQYAVLARLREPSYRLARRVRPAAGRLPP